MLDPLPTQRNRAYKSILDPLQANSRLGAFAVCYLQAVEQENKSLGTYRIYSQVLNSFLDYCNDHVPTPIEIREYLLVLKQRGCTPSTVHVHYRSLKTWFKWLIGEHAIKKNKYPMENVKGPKLEKIIVMPFTRDEIDRIMKICSGSRFFDIRMRAILLTFIDTGLRLFELAGIQRSDINLNDGIIKVMGKGRKERYVKIGLSTRVAINQYLLLRNDKLPALWLTEERTPLTKDGLGVAIFRITKLAGVTDKRRGPHVFRHTAASLCKSNGMDIYILQKMLGHSDIKTTERYLESLGFDMVADEHAKFSPVDNLFQTKRQSEYFRHDGNTAK
ncbi:MAG: tyrosine-type recombinase/integrase [Dehalococcoidales bacterium]|nr:tyrosine-type recombinase/integrase [Dehalococcoidales bacterium]